MAKIKKIYSSVWEKWAKNSIFGQKRTHFGQKREKIKTQEFPAGIYFLTFFKRTKNEFLWQKLGKFIVAFG